MKMKLLFMLTLLSFMTTACSNSLVTFEQGSTNGVKAWTVVETKSEDIDNDGKNDVITLFSYEDNNFMRKFKIRINKCEKVLEFGIVKTIEVTSFSIQQFVKLEKNTKGILIKLNSEGEIASQDSKEAPPYWFDHNFIVVEYARGEITTILDGINMPFNKKSNYTVRYTDDYGIEFLDTATKFSAKYIASLYKSQDDGIQRLKSLNDNETSGISCNYFNVKVQDLNLDGIDEIISSKYIPGLYHADLLGIIDYTFSYKNGKYVLSRQALRYDGSLGLETVKQMNIL